MKRVHFLLSNNIRAVTTTNASIYPQFQSPPRLRRAFSNLSPKNVSQVVFSGIQPTGIPHLGNYLGALANWVHLQRNAGPADELIFSIVGWHALTLPQNAKSLSEARWDMLATLLAIGLDPSKCVIFHQDQNPDHLELAWLFNCLTAVGKLRRMTSWKGRLMVSRNANDESEVDESMLNNGLFSYPVLQAADILLYKATHVPVGDDQQQHLELTRDLASVFNRTFGVEYFPPPQTILTSTTRIFSLKDPTAKMSKSAVDPNSRILITDDYSGIKAKVRASVTDSIKGITFDPIHRPGTSNLLSILAGCTGKQVEGIVTDYREKGHGQLKADVIEAVEETLKGPREELKRLQRDQAYLAEVARVGSQKARAISGRVLEEVRQLVGLK